MESPNDSQKRIITFKKFLSLYGKKKLAIATHNRADVDAISSAYALSTIFPKSIVCTREEMTQGAQKLVEKLGIKTTPLQELKQKEFDGLVVTDTSAYTLLPDAKEWKISCIIDHHRKDGKDMQAEVEIIDEQSPSAAEIVAGLIEGAALEMNKKAAFGLSVGIIADGARFKSARANTFETLAKLMKIAGAEYTEILSYAEPDKEEEAKVAILKAMRNVETTYASGYVIATTETDSNESDAASLITEAADVCFVAKWKNEEKETRISARARGSVRVPLNTVMAKVGKELGGAGGGHPKAAGAALKVHTKEALKRCVEVFIENAEKQ
ncbi:DHH family phosphoesterase [Candidatus Micrarchaeota archaeon]|nr:DHH family phosphoesterase [Candidatus Micrarchaeota archaeon]